MRSSQSGVGSKAPRAAAGVLALVLVATLAWVGAADAKRSSRGPAMIAGSFSDGCRDFTAHATKLYLHRDKDISYVEIHYADGRVVKDETVDSPDYSLDGAAGDEIHFAIVKSGTTSERFDCVQENSPPTARLEIKTPPVTTTTSDFLPEGWPASSRPHGPTGRAQPRFRTTAARSPASSTGAAERSATPRCARSRSASAARAAVIPTTTSRAGRSTSATGRRRAEAGARIRRQRSRTPIPRASATVWASARSHAPARSS